MRLWISIIGVGFATLVGPIYAEGTVPKITGTVRDLSGSPAGGTVVAFNPGFYREACEYSEVKTDSDGRYELTLRELTLRTQGRSTIFWGHINLTNSIVARDLERNLAAVREFVGTPTNIDLTLRPGITLTGSVKDTNGAPVKGAVATLRFLSGGELVQLDAVAEPPFFPVSEPGQAKPRPIQIDEFGSFWIPALPQGRQYWIWDVSAKGHATAGRSVGAENTQTNSYEFPAIVLKPADPKLAGRGRDR